jgi:hypothetical protein
VETEAEIAAGDPAVAFKPGGNALDRGGRDDERPAARPEHRHAERPAGGIEREPAFGGAPQGRVELKAGVDLAAAQAPPGSTRAGDDPERRRRPALLGADQDGERTGRNVVCSKRSRGQIRTVDAKQGDVRRGVASDELGGHCLAVREGDRDLAFFRERLVGGDDEAGTPDEAARPRPVGVDRNHASRGARDDPGDFGGEVLQQGGRN